MERLSRIIQNEVECKRWIPFKIRSFHASHLFYADDVILFGVATLDNLGNMIGTLKKFGTIFGLNLVLFSLRPYIIDCVESSPNQFIFLHLLPLESI